MCCRSQQTREHRRVAKVINFGVIYGLSPFGLAQQLGIDTERSRAFHRQIFRALQRRERISRPADRRNAQDRRHQNHLSAASVPFPKSIRRKSNLRNFAERTAMNTPMQGAAADLIKLAMIEARSPPARGEFRIANDSAGPRRVALRRPRGRNPAASRKLVKEVMEGVHKLKRPLVVETKVGPNWRDMK